jgi:hypothetical protein
MKRCYLCLTAGPTTPVALTMDVPTITRNLCAECAVIYDEGGTDAIQMTMAECERVEAAWDTFAFGPEVTV